VCQVFYGGLEAIVGSPNPHIRKTMADEHTDRDDSARDFTTSNYDLRTTSATEWAFVATPDAPPAGGWPVEEKIRAALAGEEGADLEGIRKAGAHHRQPYPLAELKAAMDAKVNGQLRKLSEPEMIVEEALGLRLYTGPLFVKYNGVLRGYTSKVPFLQKQLIGYCCAASVEEEFAAASIGFAEAKGKANIYTTTLHVINSGIVKTSKLTYAGKVYRGVSGMALPPEFWKPNEHGVKGGIEGAFMSMTTDKKVAMQYAASGGRGIVFEIQMGMIDRGADISWLSQVMPRARTARTLTPASGRPGSHSIAMSVAHTVPARGGDPLRAAHGARGAVDARARLGARGRRQPERQPVVAHDRAGHWQAQEVGGGRGRRRTALGAQPDAGVGDARACGRDGRARAVRDP
jgi:hypothetical protein